LRHYFSPLFFISASVKGQDEAGWPSPSLDEFGKVEGMDFKPGPLQSSGCGGIFFLNDNFFLTQADHIGAHRMAASNRDGPEPGKKAGRKEAAAAQDGIRIDDAHGAPDVEVGRGKKESPDLIAHRLEQTGHLLEPRSVCPLGLADEGDLAGQDHISPFGSSGSPDGASAGNAERIERFGHPVFLPSPGAEAHPQPDVTSWCDQACVPRENAVRVPGQLVEANDLGTELTKESTETAMLSQSSFFLGDLSYVVGFRVINTEIFCLRRRDNHTS